MTYSQWILFILVIQVVHFLGTYKLYQRAGREAWEALVPFYSAVVMMKIINRPSWWVFLLVIPVVNLLMFPVIWVETARSFGHNSTKDTWLAILTLGFYNFYLSYGTDSSYINDRSLKPRTEVGEWVSSIVFAIVAATIVHTYFFQPFTIPTSSLEKSLLVGDYLFVSKIHYGARVPMTPIAAPMVHDTIPLVGVRSYAKKPSIPYFRFPGFESIERNDIVVFNWPADTVEQFFKRPDRKIIKPIDKKSNYVKRAVGMPGDLLEVRDGYVFINGEQNVLPSRAHLQFYYDVDTKGQQLSGNAIVNRYHVREGYFNPNDKKYVLNLDQDNLKKVQANPLVVSTERRIQPAGKGEQGIYPTKDYGWNNDNYGPILIPSKGMVISLTPKNLKIYAKVIKDYEGHDLTTNGDQVYIDGALATEYTVEQDYYWMMGDNRQASEDSRYWGFVPFDHVVGKPVFIFLSLDANKSGFNKIRWDRVFTTVAGEGPRTSYLPHFLVLLALWYGVNKYRKRGK
ncbi:MAG: signal peptidase I [Flavobacteriaceae bacterium]